MRETREIFDVQENEEETLQEADWTPQLVPNVVN